MASEADRSPLTRFVFDLSHEDQDPRLRHHPRKRSVLQQRYLRCPPDGPHRRCCDRYGEQRSRRSRHRTTQESRIEQGDRCVQTWHVAVPVLRLRFQRRVSTTWYDSQPSQPMKFAHRFDLTHSGHYRRCNCIRVL